MWCPSPPSGGWDRRPIGQHSRQWEPTEWSLGIPAIFGVLSHLFIEVLSESDVMVDVEADFLQRQIYSNHEVAKGLVVYYALVDWLADGDHSWGSCLCWCYWLYRAIWCPWCIWIWGLRVDEALDFGHLKLSDAQVATKLQWTKAPIPWSVCLKWWCLGMSLFFQLHSPLKGFFFSHSSTYFCVFFLYSDLHPHIKTSHIYSLSRHFVCKFHHHFCHLLAKVAVKITLPSSQQG